MEERIDNGIGAFFRRMAGASWRGRAAVAAALLAAALIHWLSGTSLAVVYSIPVALAAAIGRRRLASGALLLSVAALLARSPRQETGARAGEAAALAVLAAAVGVAASRERRQRRHYQQAAERLSAVYEKVQANFEGMKRAERLSAIGQLSAGLAHEIRNPLASISGAAAILARNRDLDSKSEKCLDIITGESQRLNDLLTNFLNFARPRAPRFQTVQLETVVEKALGLASHGVRGKTIRFERRTAPDLPPVECDPEQLEQVLLNLMINAIEASPDGGTVTLSVDMENGKIAIGVVDEGHGVAPAHVDRLFDPFFTTKEHGTGLGLPVAHQIIRQMGGSLLARRNPDRGMTFSVMLPAKPYTP